MSDLFVEVDEALKQERLTNLWKQYGGLVIGFIIALVAGTAMKAGYETWTKNQNEKQTATYIEVVENNEASAEDFLNIVPSLRSNLAEIAQLRAAGLLLEEGKTEEAVKIYQNIEQEADKGSTLGQLAHYMIIELSNELDDKEKLNELDTIASEENNPWRFHAYLKAAVLEASLNKNFSKARFNLSEILKSTIAPKTLKQKAQSLDILYSLQAQIEQQSDKT